MKKQKRFYFSLVGRPFFFIQPRLKHFLWFLFVFAFECAFDKRDEKPCFHSFHINRMNKLKLYKRIENVCLEWMKVRQKRVYFIYTAPADTIPISITLDSNSLYVSQLFFFCIIHTKNNCKINECCHWYQNCLLFDKNSKKNRRIDKKAAKSDNCLFAHTHHSDIISSRIQK